MSHLKIPSDVYASGPILHFRFSFEIHSRKECGQIWNSDSVNIRSTVIRDVLPFRFSKFNRVKYSKFQILHKLLPE